MSKTTYAIRWESKNGVEWPLLGMIGPPTPLTTMLWYWMFPTRGYRERVSYESSTIEDTSRALWALIKRPMYAARIEVFLRVRREEPEETWRSEVEAHQTREENLAEEHRRAIRTMSREVREYCRRTRNCSVDFKRTHDPDWDMMTVHISERVTMPHM